MEMPRGARINVVSPPRVSETLEATGRDASKGLPAAKAAKAYVESVEGTRNGETLDARKLAQDGISLARAVSRVAHPAIHASKTGVSALETAVAGSEAGVAALKTAVPGSGPGVSALETALSGSGAGVSALETVLSGSGTGVSALKSAVSAAQTGVSAVGTAVRAARGAGAAPGYATSAAPDRDPAVRIPGDIVPAAVDEAEDASPPLRRRIAALVPVAAHPFVLIPALLAVVTARLLPAREAAAVVALVVAGSMLPMLGIIVRQVRSGASHQPTATPAGSTSSPGKRLLHAITQVMASVSCSDPPVSDKDPRVFRLDPRVFRGGSPRVRACSRPQPKATWS
ncbi:MAG: hypothetical protein ACJ759_10900 [Thermoanaerobaculia bacterium]